eukprot:6204871-Pleurochrysis_carterae.AAC.4
MLKRVPEDAVIETIDARVLHAVNDAQREAERLVVVRATRLLLLAYLVVLLGHCILLLVAELVELARSLRVISSRRGRSRSRGTQCA